MKESDIAINQRWELNGMIYRIRHIRDGLIWVEVFPTRGMWPIALCDWLESGAKLLPPEEKPRTMSEPLSETREESYQRVADQCAQLEMETYKTMGPCARDMRLWDFYAAHALGSADTIWQMPENAILACINQVSKVADAMLAERNKRFPKAI